MTTTETRKTWVRKGIDPELSYEWLVKHTGSK